MPELPEIETTRRGLLPRIKDLELSAVVVRHPRLRWPVPTDINERLQGRRLKGITRRGKYLLFDFSELTQIVHLGMSGSLRFAVPDQSPTVHDHVDWVFADRTVLRLRDPRRFGAVLLTDDPNKHPLLAHLGPEPLSADFDGDTLYRTSRGAKTAIKNFIMDSKRLAGVGNIYASESLFAAGIRPGTAAGRLTRPACGRLAKAIKAVLQAAIDSGGSSLRDYVASDGEMGFFQLHTKVYDRAGLPCKICQTPIKRIVQGQRASFYCPHCQHY
ncbi:MAG: bifunctional DNA-formamidopyrimidine glycosylase/DNA-(apurinic or apyrimidinic site) lyase [Thiobacillaceae bacterium]